MAHKEAFNVSAQEMADVAAPTHDEARSDEEWVAEIEHTKRRENDWLGRIRSLSKD